MNGAREPAVRESAAREPAAREPAAVNPFSTRHVRPGAMAYLFPRGQSEGSLLGRLEENGWWGQIVGPHGSGKSALLAALMTALEEAKRPTLLVELHDGQRSLGKDSWPPLDPPPGALVIVDGYEQLGLLARWRLKRRCRRSRLGLLVTAHASVGLPDLVRTAAGLDTVERIVTQLLGEDASRISREEIHRRFTLHQGNVRETLFDLYDLYEQGFAPNR